MFRQTVATWLQAAGMVLAAGGIVISIVACVADVTDFWTGGAS